jgi:uncharacterized membrane-anchored protein YhcB (DUF1043 family)
MALFWLALAFAVVATIVSAVVATRRGLEAFRAFKSLGRTTSVGLERIEASTAQIETHLALAAESSTRLDASLAQLSRSRAQLNVLKSAIDEVRDSIDRVTAVYPRK